MQLKPNQFFISFHISQSPIPKLPQPSKPSSTPSLVSLAEPVIPCTSLYVHIDPLQNYEVIHEALERHGITAYKWIKSRDTAIQLIRIDAPEHIVRLLDLFCQHDWLEKMGCQQVLQFRNSLSMEKVYRLTNNNLFSYLQVQPGEKARNVLPRMRLFYTDSDDISNRRRFLTGLDYQQSLNIDPAVLAQEVLQEASESSKKLDVEVADFDREMFELLNAVLCDNNFLLPRDGQQIARDLGLGFAEPVSGLIPAVAVKEAPEKKEEAKDAEDAFQTRQYLTLAFKSIEIQHVKLLQILLGNGVTDAELTQRDDALAKLARTVPLEVRDLLKLEYCCFLSDYLRSVDSNSEISAVELLPHIVRCLFDAAEITVNRLLQEYKDNGANIPHGDDAYRPVTTLVEWEQWLRTELDKGIQILISEFNTQRNEKSTKKLLLESIDFEAVRTHAALAGLMARKAELTSEGLAKIMMSIQEKQQNHTLLIEQVFADLPRFPGFPAEYSGQALADLKATVLGEDWRSGVGPNSQNERGESLLYHALARPNYAAVLLLLKRGANPDLKMGNQKTVWELIQIDQTILQVMQQSARELSDFRSRYRENVAKVLQKYEKVLKEREEDLKHWLWRLFVDKKTHEERKQSFEVYQNAVAASEVSYDDNYLASVIIKHSPSSKTRRGALGRSELHDGVYKETKYFLKDKTYGMSQERILDIVFASEQVQELREQLQAKAKEADYFKQLAMVREETNRALQEELKQTKAELGKTQAELGETKTALGTTKAKQEQTQTELGETKEKVAEMERRLDKNAQESAAAIREAKQKADEATRANEETQRQLVALQAQVEAIVGGPAQSAASSYTLGKKR